MVQDDLGLFQLEPNGTVFSFDLNNTVIDSKQLTPEEFKDLTGCNMAEPGMPSTETEQCMQNKTTVSNTDISVRSDNEVFERDLSCIMYLCVSSDQCSRLTSVSCKGCLRSAGVQKCAFW
jgi:hypothetical protein